MIWQDISSPCASVKNTIIPLSWTQDCFFVCYISLYSYSYFGLSYSIFFLFATFFIFFFLIPFYLLYSHTLSLTHFPDFSYHKTDMWDKARGHTTPKKNMLLTTNTLCFAPALSLQPENDKTQRWAKVQVRKRTGLIISKIQFGHVWTCLDNMEQTITCHH